jgi:PRTRC genetic system protein C
MAATINQLTRVFEYGGMELPDPGAGMTPSQVRDTFSAAYPELATAEVVGPETRGNKLVYSFRRQAGAKG